jgi:hypothetical protein
MTPRTKTLKLVGLAIAAVAVTLLFCCTLGFSDAASYLGIGALGMAVTANQITPRRNGDRASCPVAASKRLYGGTMVFIDATTGLLTDTHNAGANKFAGILVEEVDNSSGAASALTGEYWTKGSFVLTGSGFTQADVEKVFYAVDNYTITATSTSNAQIGVVREYISATKLLVEINVTL